MAFTNISLEARRRLLILIQVIWSDTQRSAVQKHSTYATNQGKFILRFEPKQ